MERNLEAVPVKNKEARKNRKASILIFFILIFTAVQVLTACTASSVVPDPSRSENRTENESGTENGSSRETEATVPEDAFDEMRKIVILRPQLELAAVNTEEVKRVENAVNAALLKRNSEYYVEIREIYAKNYESTAEKALTSGQASIVFCDRLSKDFSDRALMKKGLAADLTELLPKSRTYSLIPENVLALSKIDGKNYSIPICGEAALSYSLLLSKDFADGYGLDPNAEAFKASDLLTLLKNLPTYLEDARNVDTVSPLFTGNSLVPAAYAGQIEFFDTESAPLFGLDRETLSSADVVRDADYAELLKLMARYRELGYIDPDFSTAPDENGRTYAFWLKEKEAGEDYRYPDAYRIPLSMGSYLQESHAPRGAYVISSALDAQGKQDALDFIADLFSIKEIADPYTYGILNADYVIGEDGKVLVAADRNYAHNAWESTSVVPLTPREADPDFYAESCEDMNRNAELSKAAGFLFDPTPVQAEYDACIRLYKSQGVLLEQGSYGREEVDGMLNAYIEALEEAGYDKVREEIDRQITSFHAGAE